jgi:hypothetical protein
MVIAMIAMPMVELSLIEIISVIAMRNGLVSAFVMSTCTIRWSTTIRVLATHMDHMLIIVSFMGRVQMTIMQVVQMTIMLDCRMPAMLTMDMGVFLMNVVTHQPFSFVSEIVSLHTCALFRTTQPVFSILKRYAYPTLYSRKRILSIFL